VRRGVLYPEVHVNGFKKKSVGIRVGLGAPVAFPPFFIFYIPLLYTIRVPKTKTWSTNGRTV
jgi:hypothetical protein